MATAPVKRSAPRRTTTASTRKPAARPQAKKTTPSRTTTSTRSSQTTQPSRTTDTSKVDRAKEPDVRPETKAMTDTIKDDLSREQAAAARAAERRDPGDRRENDGRRENDIGGPGGIDRRGNTSDRRAGDDRRVTADRRGEVDKKPGEEFDVKKNSLDLSKKQSVGGIKRAIDFMANENGEETSLGFHLEGAGRHGSAKLGGWGDLGLKVSQSDTGSTVLGFNYEAAVKAGLDLKFLEIGGAVGVKGGVQARFKDSGDAAAWLGEGLHKFGEKTGLVDVQKQKFVYDKPTTVKAQGVFGKGQFSTKFGPFELSGEAGMETIGKTFTNPDGTTQKGRETALTAGLNRKLKIGDFEYDVNYSYKRSTITGDANENNNGTYDNHQVGIQLSLDRLKKMSPNQIRSTIAGLAMMNGGQGMGGKAIEAMVNNIDKIMQNPAAAGVKGSIGLRFEANNVLENGKMENQYKRLYLDMGASFGGKADLGFAEAEARTKLQKSERISETLGTGTETYAKQNLAALERKGQWPQYKEQNKDALFSIARQHQKANPSPELAKALKEGDKDKAIELMTRGWKNEEKVNKQIKGDARTLANYGNQWVFSNGEEAKMLNMLKKYDGRWGEMSKLFKQMESQGLTRDKLLDKTGGYFSTHDEQLKGYYDIVKQWERLNAS